MTDRRREDVRTTAPPATGSERPRDEGVPAECPRLAEASAWAQDALEAEPARDFERHLVGCEACRAWVDQARGLLGDLQRLGGPAARPRPRRIPWRAAAALLLVVLAAQGLRRGDASDATAPAVPLGDGPVAWLADALDPSGTWPAGTALEGAPTAPRGRSGVGLHGLGLLALIEGSEPGAHEAAIDRATDWLLAAQADDGLLDATEPFAGFGHVVGTAALLEAAGRSGRPDVRAAADRAVQRLLDEGAGRFPGRGPAANTALTAWTLRVVTRADELGWEGLEPLVDAGRARLAAECGAGVRPSHLGRRQVAALALTPHSAPVAAALGPLYVAAEGTLVRRGP